MTAPITPATDDEPDAPDTEAPDETTADGTSTHYEPEGEELDDDINPPEEGEGEAVVPVDGTAAVETPEPADDVQPLRIRAGGQEVEIAGALVAKEGMYVPADKLPDFLQVVQRGVYHQNNWRQEIGRERQEVARQVALREVSEAKASVYTKAMEQVFASEDAFLAFAENLPQNLALLNKDVASAELAAKFAAQQKGINLDTPYNVLSGDELLRQSSEAVVNQYNEVLRSPDLRQLLPDQQSQDQVFALLMRTPQRYIYPAPHEMPDIGVRKGDYVVDKEALAQDARQLAALRPAQQARAATVEKAKDRAAQVNRAVNAAPTTRPAVKSPAPGRPHRAKTAEEWRRNLLRMAKD